MSPPGRPKGEYRSAQHEAPVNTAPDAVDAAALNAHLREHLPGFDALQSIQRLSGGQSNPTYRISTASRRWVIRTKPAPVARLLPSAHAIEREFRVLHALAGSAVPVPAVHLLCTDEAVIGRAFYVMDCVEGRVLWDPALPGMTKAQRTAVYDEMHRVLAELHCVDFEATGLADFGARGDYFARQVRRWSRQYQDSATTPIDAMERLIEWLPSHLPVPDDHDVRLVHGDFRLDNLVFHHDEPRVVAVLDWELATLGHPLADLGYYALPWTIPASTGRGIVGKDWAALGIPDVPQLLRTYSDLTGRRVDVDGAEWRFSIVFNLFRLAAILQGIARRDLDGTAANANARQTGSLARTMAELGWSVADGEP